MWRNSKKETVSKQTENINKEIGNPERNQNKILGWKRIITKMKNSSATFKKTWQAEE